MPALDQILVYLIVAAAGAYLVGRQIGKKQGSCGGCEGCPTSTETAPTEIRSELMQIEPAPKEPTRGSG